MAATSSLSLARQLSPAMARQFISSAALARQFIR
jgi:hypothetical protein